MNTLPLPPSAEELELREFFAARGGRAATAELARECVLPSYFVCFTNRSGSTVLSLSLSRTAVAGDPREYFNNPTVMRCAQNHSLSSMRDYCRFAKRSHCARGQVFGAKIGLYQLLHLSREGLLAEEFPGARFIFVTRRDRVAQAVSLHIAKSTGRWTSRHEAEDDARAEYDEERILSCLVGLHRTHALFEAYFSLHGIEPVRVVYEDFIADPQTQLKRTLEELGFPTGAEIDCQTLPLERQRDDLNVAFVQRFRDSFRFRSALGASLN